MGPRPRMRSRTRHFSKVLGLCGRAARFTSFPVPNKKPRESPRAVFVTASFGTLQSIASYSGSVRNSGKFCDSDISSKIFAA